jgi:hypothetical protein
MQQLRDVQQLDEMKLDILARGEMGLAAAVLFSDLRENKHLVRRNHP